MKTRLFLTTLACAVAIAALLAIGMAGTTPKAAEAQGTNLLWNPSFENPYVIVGIYENMRVGNGWMAWWREGTMEQILQGYLMRPEYKAAFTYDAPFNRVHSGELSQQFFHSMANFEGGVFQIVNNARAGQRLRFSIWLMNWSCEDWNQCHEDNPPRVWSYRPSPMHMRIGIDPYGGDNAFSENIVWSGESDSYDTWSQWTVEAVAASSRVSVWTYAYPDYRTQSNDIYLDDAELVVVGTGAPPGGPTATPRPGSTSVPPANMTPGPGEQVYTVVAGDTLSGLGMHFRVSWMSIAQRNNLANPDLILIGQKLIIPAS